LENEAALLVMHTGGKVAMWGGESRDRDRPGKSYLEKILHGADPSKILSSKGSLPVNPLINR
jgi:hypothetical protein